MTQFLFSIDRISMWTGKAFAWCIMLMTVGVSYEVFVRYVLGAPTSWAFDLSYIMYGALFMLGGAYTLSRGGHVRGDVLYRLLPVRVQATVELVLYILFFFPAMIAMVFAGADYASDSWRYGELSLMSRANIPIFPFKTIIPVAGALLFLQGIAESIRCVICLRDGEWPARLHDVEEMETMLQHQHEDESEVLGEISSLAKGDGR
jgi:TRAP-type mannitol/chloroaromatic compound transport system permease small subunit